MARGVQWKSCKRVTTGVQSRTVLGGIAGENGGEIRLCRLRKLHMRTVACNRERGLRFIFISRGNNFIRDGAFQNKGSGGTLNIGVHVNIVTAVGLTGSVVWSSSARRSTHDLPARNGPCGRHPCTLAVPLGAGEPVGVVGVGVGRRLLDAAQRLVDAPRQGVGGGPQSSLLLALLPGHPPQFDSLANLNQNAVGVIVALGRHQAPLVHLPQVEAAPLQGGQHLVHGWAHCRREGGGGRNKGWVDGVDFVLC